MTELSISPVFKRKEFDDGNYSCCPCSWFQLSFFSTGLVFAGTQSEGVGTCRYLKEQGKTPRNTTGTGKIIQAIPIMFPFYRCAGCAYCHCH